jgi:hypothetical protein
MAIELKRFINISGTPGEWTSDDIVILEGEIAVSLNGAESSMRIGDGVLLYSNLAVVSRRPDAELTAYINANRAANAVDKSTGIPNAGLLALLDANGVFDATFMPDVGASDFVDDDAAAAGGVPLGWIYHTAGVLKVRLTGASLPITLHVLTAKQRFILNSKLARVENSLAATKPRATLDSKLARVENSIAATPAQLTLDAKLTVPTFS